MRRTKKSVSALIVALCMLVQLIPAFPVQKAEAYADGTSPYNYVTNRTVTEGSSSWLHAKISVGGWEIDKESTSPSIYTALEKQENDNWQVGTSIAKVKFENGGKETLGIKFDVKKAGFYNVKIKVNAYMHYSMNAFVSIDGKFLGNYTAQSIVTDLTEKTFDVGTKYFTAGEHTLQITETSGEYLYMHGFILEENPTAVAVQEYILKAPASITKWANVTNTINTIGWQLSAQTSKAFYDTIIANDDTGNYILDDGKLDINSGDTFAIDFAVEVPGYYNIDFHDMEHDNYGVNGTVSIDDVPIGKWVGTSQGIGVSKDNIREFDGIYLSGGSHTFKLTVASEVVEGRGYLWLRKMVITGDTASVSAPAVTVSEGDSSETAVTYQTTAGRAVANPITVKSNNEATATASYADGKLTVKGLKAGSTTLTLTDVTGITKEVAVTVVAKASANIGTAEEGSPFASKYAYIEENKDGTYDATFIGGINELKGYSAVGFEIDVAGNKEYSDSANVYTSLSVNGGKYNAETYGGKYIFVGSREGIAAGSKVVARPYVVVNGEKQFLANAELTLKF